MAMEPSQNKSLLGRVTLMLLMLATVLGAIARKSALSAEAVASGQIRINQLGFLPESR
jgi:hypothetical protein